jgi:hypothetical protein
MEIDHNLQINLVFYLSKRLLYLRSYVFDVFSIYILQVNNSTFCDLKVCTGSGSALRKKRWIRIHIKTAADLQKTTTLIPSQHPLTQWNLRGGR